MIFNMIQNRFFIDERQMYLYFEEHNLMNRMNKDSYVNNNGIRLIELCTVSDLKIGIYQMDKALLTMQ